MIFTFSYFFKYLIEISNSFQCLNANSSEDENMNNVFSNLTFKKLMSLMKLIMKNKTNPLYLLMQEKYILFSYFFNFPNNSISQEQFYFCSHPSSLLIEIKASLVHFEGEERIMLMFTDATDRKKSLELYTINQHKDKLLANVAHEFRTPLNGISTMLELLKIMQEDMNEKMIEYINTASFSVTLLKNYINDILDISQLKNGKFTLHFSNFDLRNLINEISTIIVVQAKKKEIVYDAFVEDKVPNMICSDQTRLTQILLNLLSNSIKFTLKNGYINLKVTMDDEIGVKFEVNDSGIGISEENMKCLFHKYGKIKSELNDALNPQGIGLGLVISKILAEELSPETHKKFQIVSEIGKGTAFSFYITNNIIETNSLNLSPKSKFSITKDENSMIDQENLEVKNKNFEILDKQDGMNCKPNNLPDFERKVMFKLNSSIKMTELSIRKRLSPSNTMLLFPVEKCICSKILVVDDDMFNVICLQELLKNIGFESDFAANGSDAIAKVNERKDKKCCEDCQEFKLIFIDSNMPILNGIETTKILKHFEFLQNLKIIGCSGDNEIEKFRIAGCDGVLIKPIQRKDLMNILNDYKDLLEQ